MRALFVPVSACLFLSGCALPLLQAASSQMIPGMGMQMTPAVPTCTAGAACPSGIGPNGISSQIANGIGASLQKMTGLASASEPAGK
ncbi:MAG TPA: hypothetical protein VFG62_01015 [Rhodopila sp.]|jgi:hypothetical protein|nr:hypothetical protein [Rhodopila sp.]